MTLINSCDWVSDKRSSSADIYTHIHTHGNDDSNNNNNNVYANYCLLIINHSAWNRVGNPYYSGYIIYCEYSTSCRRVPSYIHIYIHYIHPCLPSYVMSCLRISLGNTIIIYSCKVIRWFDFDWWRVEYNLHAVVLQRVQ